MKLTYNRMSIAHHRLAWKNKNQIRKMENWGDPRLTVCTNVEINSGLMGMNNWKWEWTALEQSHRRMIESLPVWVKNPSQEEALSRPHDSTEPRIPIEAFPQSSRPLPVPPSCCSLFRSVERGTFPLIVTMFPFPSSFYFFCSILITYCTLFPL